MYKVNQTEESQDSVIWEQIVEWSQEKYRYRTFDKDERIPARPKILYWVDRGTVKLIANSQLSAISNLEEEKNPGDRLTKSFLSFVGKGQPFELLNNSTFTIDAYAQIDKTSVLWMYWYELDNWPKFRRDVWKIFRDRQQRHVLSIATLSQRRIIDRLYGFLRILIEEHGIAYMKESQSHKGNGYYLPWSITHEEIASAIGSSRVTVTRLMGELRDRGSIDLYRNFYISLPPRSHSGDRF